jgi:oligopeptidase B
VRRLHGEDVADPYFWMRDLDDPRVLANLDAERAYYEQQTAPLAGDRRRLAAQLRARLPQVSAGCPWWQSGRRYQLVYREGAQYPQLLRRNGRDTDDDDTDDGDTDDGADEVLLDVPSLVGQATYAELGLLELSDDGRHLAYSLDLTGDEVYELRWLDVTTGVDLVTAQGSPERVPRSYYGGAWTLDGSAFYYVVHDEAYRPHQVWRHRLGTEVAADELVFVEDDRRFEVTVRRTRSGDYVVITSASRTTCHEHVLAASDPAAVPRAVRTRVEGVEDQLEHQRGPDGGRWLLVTNDGMPEFRLLVADCHNDGTEDGGTTWRELVAGRPGERLEACDAFAGGLVLSWRRNALRVLEIRTSDGSDGVVRELAPPHPAATVRLGAKHDYDCSAVVVETTSLVEPSIWRAVDLAGGSEVEVHRRQAPGHDPARYVTRRITLPARDGTSIPVTLAHARAGSGDGETLEAARRDGTAPGLLYGYGAYESCLWPEFEPALPVWLDHGVLYAVAHVRGGGEGGRSWWQQGHLRAKVTTFTDYLDVAAGLVSQGWVAADRLATRGLSAGGLLQGAAFSMRPQQWAAVVAEVPFVDCVNSMLDDGLPLTVNEWQEWGDPRDAGDYAVMRAYTPYENLPDPPWPAILVTGALHDPRVVVHEPAKWVAALRAEAAATTSSSGSESSGSESSGPAWSGSASGPVASSGPLLFRAETGPGAHAGPAGRYAAMDYEAEVMAFVLSALRVPVVDE